MILITGEKGYISTNLYNCFIKETPCKKVSVRENIDIFQEKADTLIHCSAIVHNSRAEYEECKRVNHELTVSLALRAKENGVRHFVFISTMSVFGLDYGVINSSTMEKPVNNYGKTKLMAEKDLLKLSDENFKVAILRLPMVYGKDCPGNFAKLEKLAEKLSIFPKVDNKRSMLYIENLCKFIREIVKREKEGIYYPQNSEYVNTSELFKEIRQAKNKRTYLSKIMGFIRFLNLRTVNKLFKTLIYDKELENNIDFDYNGVDFKNSIKKSVNK